MDVSVAAAHGAQLRSEVSAERIKNRVPKGEASTLVANQRSEDVAAAELDAHRDAERFLATAEEYAALDHASTIKASEFFLQHA